MDCAVVSREMTRWYAVTCLRDEVRCLEVFDFGQSLRERDFSVLR